MAPPKPSKTKHSPKTQQQKTAAVPEPVKEYPTISHKIQASYLSSRPYLTLASTKPISSLSPTEKAAYANSRFLETGAWRAWPKETQKELWTAVQKDKIPVPLQEEGKYLGKDRSGREIGTYSVEEYRVWEVRERELRGLKGKSERFLRKRDRLREREREEGKLGGEDWEAELEEERTRRKLIGHLEGRKMKKYEGDPEWDDVIPIEQEDGDGALASIAYTEEYAEAMGYLRAIMASKETTPRVLDLTEHIISLNAAHYTVWLYRARTLLALHTPISAELSWVNEVALENQKNYQIWHHRQILIDSVYESEIKNDEERRKELASTEREFMGKMFEEDSKNYHVWSYRQYLVRKLELWDDPEELSTVEELIRQDVRNNSAWAHIFFLVFSNPRITTEGSKATEPDPKVPTEIIEREVERAKKAIYEAPQNPSPWGYLRGVLRKGGRTLVGLEWFAEFFAKGMGEGEKEDVKSSHALDFLADVWAEKGEKEKAGKALELLGEKYDLIRKNYWEWRKGLVLKGEKVEA